LLGHTLCTLAAQEDVVDVLLLDGYFETSVLFCEKYRDFFHQLAQQLGLANFSTFYFELTTLLFECLYNGLCGHDFESVELGLLHGEREHVQGVNLLALAGAWFAVCLFETVLDRMNAASAYYALF